MDSATITAPHQRTSNETAPPYARSMSIWLFVMCALVALMVVVGGATRLTDSGLSITEWKPVTGAVPPLNADAWLAEFEKYKRIPEYTLVNQGMSLGDFKVIYWWEWGHRFLGRLIGVAFILPFVFFVVRGAVNRPLGVRLFVLLLLGGAQGGLGWYMVQSGLTERVDVSQYRLAAHLGLAVFLLGALLWTALDLLNATSKPKPQGRVSAQLPAKLVWWAFGLSVAVYGQIILGAFVAGLRAGRTYTTWPLMDGEFFPSAYFANGGALAVFESIAAVQFNHRMGAYFLAAAAIAFVLTARRTVLEPSARLFGLAVIGQIVLGIATIISATPLALGLLHQIGALAVFATIIYTTHVGVQASRARA